MTTRGPTRLRGTRSLARETRGSVFVEYILVALVGILVAGGLAGLAPALVAHYSQQRAGLYQVYP